jgi:hypothetical protein
MKTIPSYRGLPQPDLADVGLAKKMRPAAELIDEQQRLSAKRSDLYHEKLEITERIKDAEKRHMEALASSYRSSAPAQAEERPELEGVEEMRRRIGEIERETKAVSDAAASSAEELSQVVVEHREEWDALVQQRGEEILQEAQQMADALSRILGEADGYVALHSWLESGTRNWSPPTPTSITVENLLHEKRRGLGLLEAELGVVR